MEPKTKISGSEKSAVARGWTKSGLTMSSYARMHGISERTLRNWRAIYAPASPVTEARRTVEKAIGQLQALLGGIPLDPEPAGCLPSSEHGWDQERGGSVAVPVSTAPRSGDEQAVRQVAIPAALPAPATTGFDWN